MHEINITPLLDLAFVLLVIFVLTTTPLAQDVDLKLPTAASRPKDPPKKPNFISVDAKGTLYLNTVPTDLARLQEGLIEMRKADPDLSVIIRGDSTIRYQHVSAVLDVLQQVNVVKVSLATDPASAGGSGN
jgi:biopolymer transport protein ExbD